MFRMLQVRLVQLLLWTLKMSYWWKLTFQISWGLLLHFTGAGGKFIMVLVKFLHDCMYQKLFKLVYFYWVIQKLKSHFHSYCTIKFFTRFWWHCWCVICADGSGINDNVVLSQQQDRTWKCGRVCQRVVSSDQRPFCAREGCQRFLSRQVCRSTSLLVTAEAWGQSAVLWSCCLHMRFAWIIRLCHFCFVFTSTMNTRLNCVFTFGCNMNRDNTRDSFYENVM